MSEREGTYSPEFQHARQLVKTALAQAATDARELAERTGTQLVIRARPESGDENARVLDDVTARERR